jgi:hypothetical protein
MTDEATEMQAKRDRLNAKRRARYRGLAPVDRRSNLYRRIVTLTETYVQQLGGDVTAGMRERCARCAQLSCLAEDTRLALLNGKEMNLDPVVRIENLATRTLAALGLDQHATMPVKSSLPSLAEMIRGRDAKALTHG